MAAYLHVGLPDQPPRQVPSRDTYIALASGVGVGSEDGQGALRMGLLVDYLAGVSGDVMDHEEVAKVGDGL